MDRPVFSMVHDPDMRSLLSTAPCAPVLWVRLRFPWSVWCLAQMSASPSDTFGVSALAKSVLEKCERSLPYP